MKPLYQKMKEERGEWLRQARALERSLTPAQRAPLDAYLEERPGLSKAGRADWRERFLMHLEENGPDSGPDWLAYQRQFDAELAEEHARYEKEQAERAQAKAERAQEWRQAIQAAIATGQPVPAKYRPPGARCVLCRRLLRDPESVRLGIGPECRKGKAQ